jgi:hypothetical protein
MAFCHKLAQPIETDARLGAKAKDRQRLPIESPQLSGQLSGTIQVLLVNDEKGFEPGRTGRHDSAIDKSGGRQGPRSDHHTEHIKVGANQMHRPAHIATAQFSATGQAFQNLATNQYRIANHMAGAALNPYRVSLTVSKKHLNSHPEMGDNHPFTAGWFCALG